jgi:N-acyl-D-aspartate/D-glutamate deacylase
MHVRRIEQTLVLALLAVVPQTLAAQQPVSTLIRNASVIDGRGTPARNVSVRITGDRISDVGDLTAMASDRVVDAQGLTLTPGLIDTHSHHDRGLFEDGDALAMLSQGVTTIVIGQDGGGSGLADLFARIDAQPVAVNVASYAGHGPLRRAVLGDDFRRAATAAEVERMKSVLREEMAAGALGLSTGLEYDPGIYSAPAEVLALARVAAEAGGRYISHIRSEDRYFWNALDEMIAIGRTHYIPVQVSHMKLGMIDLWGQADSVIRVLDRARASGVDVTELDLMKQTAYLINMERGPVVDHPALLKCLQERRIAGAGLDVFYQEPLPATDPLLELDNVVLSPHWAAGTLDVYYEAGLTACKAMLQLAQGYLPENIVNQEVIDRPGFQAKLAQFRENRE